MKLKNFGKKAFFLKTLIKILYWLKKMKKPIEVSTFVIFVKKNRNDSKFEIIAN